MRPYFVAVPLGLAGPADNPNAIPPSNLARRQDLVIALIISSTFHLPRHPPLLQIR